jgi:hypothetical protein
LAKQNDFSANEQLKNHVEFVTNPEPNTNGKKPFVEPEISAAVDVLEATTFFQAATSGATN